MGFSASFQCSNISTCISTYLPCFGILIPLWAKTHSLGCSGWIHFLTARVHFLTGSILLSDCSYSFTPKIPTVCHSPCQTQRETAFLCYNAHKYNRAKPIPLGDPPVMGRRCLNTLEDFSLCVFMFLGSWLLCTTALSVQGKQPFAGGVTWQCCFQRCRLTADISIQLCWAAGLSGELN